MTVDDRLRYFGCGSEVAEGQPVGTLVLYDSKRRLL